MWFFASGFIFLSLLLLFFCRENSSTNHARGCPVGWSQGSWFIGLLLANTVFPHPQRHKTTWVAPPRPGYRDPTHNQIDFCIVKGVHQCMLLDSHSYSGTATSSDHFMVITRMKLGIPNRQSKHHSTRTDLCNRRYDVMSLATKEDVQLVSKLKLLEKLASIMECLGRVNVEELWNALKDTIHEGP